MNNRNVVRLVDIIILVCAIMLQSFFDSGSSLVISIINVIVAIFFWLWLLKYAKQQFTKGYFMGKVAQRNKGIVIVSGLSALTIVNENVGGFIEQNSEAVVSWLEQFTLKDTYISLFAQIWFIFVAGMSSIALTLLLLVFWNIMLSICGRELKKFDDFDKKYFVIGSASIILCISSVYFVTKVFHNSGVDWDVVYRSDTGFHVKSNVWMTVNNQENDIRQPLFAIFSMPFSALAKIISTFLGFIPNSYAIILNILQAHLLLFSNYLVAKMIKLNGHAKLLFLLFSNFTYSWLLFYFNMEQYQFAVFYLLFGIYLIQTQEEYTYINFMSVGATGTLITSGLILFFSGKVKEKKMYVSQLFRKGLLFLGVLAAFGRLNAIFEMKHLEFVLGFSSRGDSGRVRMMEKILQFFNFCKSIFVKPETLIENEQYNLASVEKISIVGGVVVLFVFISFFVNYKEQFARVCFIWVLLSMAVLIGMGWGALENGMILYSLYFGWAYIALIALMIKRLLVKERKWIYVAGYVMSGIWIGVNLYGIMDLIDFGIKHYFPY